MTTNHIHAAIITAMREAAEIGIAKTATATLGGAAVRYRGIEQAMNTMVAILVRCGITVIPAYSDLQIGERAKDGGKFTRFCTLRGRFTFAAADGSHVVAEAYGEAMDSGDKAVTKAQSVAFRTALFQTFVIPTRETAIDPESDDDDNTAPPAVPVPADMRAAAEKGVESYRAFWEALPNAKRRDLFQHHEAMKKAAAEADAARAADAAKVPA